VCPPTHDIILPIGVAVCNTVEARKRINGKPPDGFTPPYTRVAARKENRSLVDFTILCGIVRDCKKTIGRGHNNWFCARRLCSFETGIPLKPLNSERNSALTAEKSLHYHTPTF